MHHPIRFSMNNEAKQGSATFDSYQNNILSRISHGMMIAFTLYLYKSPTHEISYSEYIGHPPQLPFYRKF